MLDYRLPDGTWVTTAIYAGFGKSSTRCDDNCDWEDQGPPGTGGPVPVQMQRCTRCGWVRGKYLGNPHPDMSDDDVEGTPGV